MFGYKLKKSQKPSKVKRESKMEMRDDCVLITKRVEPHQFREIGKFGNALFSTGFAKIKT
jgi:hypothetical protein